MSLSSRNISITSLAFALPNFCFALNFCFFAENLTIPEIKNWKRACGSNAIREAILRRVLWTSKTHAHPYTEAFDCISEFKSRKNVTNYKLRILGLTASPVNISAGKMVQLCDKPPQELANQLSLSIKKLEVKMQAVAVTCNDLADVDRFLARPIQGSVWYEDEDPVLGESSANEDKKNISRSTDESKSRTKRIEAKLEQIKAQCSDLGSKWLNEVLTRLSARLRGRGINHQDQDSRKIGQPIYEDFVEAAKAVRADHMQMNNLLFTYSDKVLALIAFLKSYQNYHVSNVSKIFQANATEEYDEKKIETRCSEIFRRYRVCPNPGTCDFARGDRWR